MTVEQALKELNKYGLHIVQLEADKFLCYDTGLFRFLEEADPFIIDGNSVLEIYENCLGEIEE